METNDPAEMLNELERVRAETLSEQRHLPTWAFPALTVAATASARRRMSRGEIVATLVANIALFTLLATVGWRAIVALGVCYIAYLAYISVTELRQRG